MGDEEDTLALGGEALHDAHELLDLLGGEDGSGLIEDENLVVPVEHFEDLRALLHPHGDVLDEGVRVHLQSVALGERQDLLPGLLLLQEAHLVGLHAQDDVVQHREALHQLEVLVDHADSQVVGIVGVFDVHLFAVLADLALLGLVEAEEHAHEGALASAVLPQERVDLALFQLQGDIVIGHDAGETLGDVEHFDRIGFQSSIPPFHVVPPSIPYLRRFCKIYF